MLLKIYFSRLKILMTSVSDAMKKLKIAQAMERQAVSTLISANSLKQFQSQKNDLVAMAKKKRSTKKTTKKTTPKKTKKTKKTKGTKK